MAYETSDPGASGGDAPAGLSDDAASRAGQVRASAADGLSTVAGAMHTGGERIAGAAHRAGDALDSGAEYLRGNELTDMMDDLGDLVRNHPGPALLCAAALGFVLGRAAYRH